MDLAKIGSMHTMSPSPLKPSSSEGAGDVAKQFSSFLSNALDKVQNQQDNVETLTNQFESGDLTDVHKLLIASEQASVGLQLTVQMRNKVIEAYQEIMRTQV